MSLPVFLADDISADRLEILGDEGRHAATVRRIRVGESVQLVDGRGSRAQGVVAAARPASLVIDVQERVFEPPQSPRLVLVQALAKGDRGELAVELATEVGVDEIVPWSAARCIVRWEGDRGSRSRARWIATSRAAAKQSRRSWLPVLAEPVTTEELAVRVAGCPSFVLHEGAPARLSTIVLPATEPGLEIVVVAGPEGGITDEELALLTGQGATSVRLGPTVLRTSTAGAAALAVLSARTGRW
ncbi:MAG: 16S rRNA (uracil(1498)-N(3))-methyltransferase [Actinomycetota bacterium]|nr:16S rRNA (uracil(1498)-N(3))-methyltransferase [Actinomycetota bacterium]